MIDNSISSFESHKNKVIKPALEAEGITNLPMNSLNNITAKSLGFSSYESIRFFHIREKNIEDGLQVEICNYQDSSITIKAKNFIFVLPQKSNKVLFRALDGSGDAGGTRDFINQNNATMEIDYSEYLPKGTTLMCTDLCMPLSTENHRKGARAELDALCSDGITHIFSFYRTDESVCLDLKIKNADGKIINVIKNQFDFAEHLASGFVDQANPILF
jgi:hypothetical protein